MEENVRIVVTGNNRDALSKINKVEEAVNRLNSATKQVEVKVSGLQEAERQADRLYQALERLESAALSKLPQSLQTVIAYLKAANAGLGEFTRRAITAAAAVGDIGRVPFAPIIKAQSQAIRQFQQMERGLVSLRVEFVKVFDRGSTQPLLDGLNLVRVSILETKGLLEGRGDFTRPILDGLDLVKVRIIEIKGLLGGLGGTGGGGRIPPGVPPNAPQLPPGVGPQGRQGRGFSFDPSTLQGLRQGIRYFQELLETAEIGSTRFRVLEDTIADLNKKLEDAQLKFQKAVTAPVPGSLSALRAEIAAKQASLEQTAKGTKEFNDLANELRQLNKELNKTENFIEGRTKGIKGRFGTAAQSAALGGGFPLLFGGPSISAAGGALGGFAGGLAGPGAGFALGIVGSAIGGGIDEIIANAQEAGKALNSTGGALDLMREKSLFSSKAVEEQAAVLEEQGKVAELSSLLTQELVDKIGNKGVEALQGLGKETDETTRLWNELTLQLQVLIAGPLKNFLALVNNVLGNVTRAGRVEAFLKDTGARESEARQRFDELTGRNLGTGRSGAKKRQEAKAAGTIISDEAALAQIKKEFPVAATANIPITLEDQRRFAVKGKGVDRAAREEARLQERLAKLRLEREEIARITEFKDRIAAAEAVQDQLTARRIQGEQSVYEVQQAGLKALVGVTDQREIQEIKLLTAARVTATIRDTERETLKIQRERDELFKNTMENLKLQLDIETATTREEAEQLRITQEMKALEGKGLSQDQMGRIRSAKEALSESREPLNKFINDSTKALNDVQQVGVTVAQGIGGAFATAMTTGVQELVRGTKSAEEVFADFLNNVANILMQVAQQMIATYIAIGIARAFAGMGTSGGDPNSAAVGEVLQGGGFTTGNLADAAASTPLKLNAAGSYVSGPTATLVGEGGESEYIIPESKMRESMARYSRGARGSSVIPDSGVSGTSGEGGGTAVAAPIDIRYTVERINNVDYVTADQFMAGMQRAVDEGAKQGEQKTLRRLQMSGSTRKRLGL